MAGERRRVLIGLLRVVRGDRLIDAADIDGPAVAGLEAEGAAPAARIDAVDGGLATPRIVDLSPVAGHKAHEAPRVTAFPPLQLWRRSATPAVGKKGLRE